MKYTECDSFLKSDSPEIVALCETNLDDSVHSGHFSEKGYLPLNQKASVTHMDGLVVYVKEGLPFAWDLSLENSADSYLCFRLLLIPSINALLLFPPSITFIFMHNFLFYFI